MVMQIERTGSKSRADFLVSVAMVLLSSDDGEIDAIKALPQSLSRHFQFWEIVIVVPMTHDSAMSSGGPLSRIPNVRLLRVDNTDNFYRLRLAAVSEAIGDVVVVTTAQELPQMDLSALAAKVYQINAPIIMTREARLGAPPLFSKGLGYLTGYRIDSHDTLTAGFPRSWLGAVLSRPDADLLLRFEPRSTGSRFHREVIEKQKRVPRNLRSTGRRLRLLGDLMASSAPRVLRGVSALSFVVTIIAAFYGVYAVGVWSLKANVEPGWLTTSMIQVMIVGLLGIAFSAISMGIVKLLDRIEGMMRYTVVDEASNVAMFNDVKDLNVVLNKPWQQPGQQPAEVH